MASGDILDDKGAATTHHNINTLQVLKTIHILLQPEGQEHPPASASTLPPPDYNTVASLCECWKRATPVDIFACWGTSRHCGQLVASVEQQMGTAGHCRSRDLQISRSTTATQTKTSKAQTNRLSKSRRQVKAYPLVI